MTKSEFLAKLQEALAQDLSSPLVQENVNYYSQYIDDEVRGGRPAEAVVAELGDPWALAKTIIESEEIKKKKADTYQQSADNSTYHTNRTQNSSYEQGHHSRVGRTGKMILTTIVVILVIMAFFSLLSGVFSLIAPIAIPLLVLFLLIRMFTNRRG